MWRKIKNNLYLLLIYRVLLLVLLYTACRFIFYLSNVDLFANIRAKHLLTLFQAGLTFDISAIFYINILYIVAQIIPFDLRYKLSYQRVLKILFCVSNSVFFFFNCADFAYFRFTSRRTTLSVFREFANDAGNFNLITQLIIDYWWIVFIWLIITLIMIFTYGSIRVKHPSIHLLKSYYIKQVGIMALVLLVIVIGMRGGINSLPPININHATLKVDKAIESNIVLNTSFTLVRTSKQKSIKMQDFYSEDQLEKIYIPVHYPHPTEDFQYKNVFILILEGFSKANIGYYTKQVDSTYVGYTPFLDSLIAESYAFKYSFANGFTSIDATPSIIAGMPSLLPGNYVSSIYANNHLVGLGELLNEKGYDCSFFHGADNGSMRFLEFSRQAGFKHYYGRTEYNNDDDYDGTWGIFDEPFFQFTAQIINNKPQPFLSILFTLSSHGPNVLPPQYKDVFPKGEEEMHELVGYTDFALRRFFDTASKMPWFENTLFVFVSDHTSPIRIGHDKFKNSIGVLSIPVVFYDPSGKLSKMQEEEKLSQQIDIMPSILDYLNYDKPYFAFGSSVFREDHKNFSISIQNGIYQFIYENYALQVSGDNKQIAFYDYVNDPALSRNLLNEGVQVPGQIDSLFKAFLQQYNNRLIENRTVLDEKK
ncbi:MAG: sulfatase-like hydrolase/transferase [Prevotellaceae bacterium]|jgi:phosphoglycerol transferase MdoB-like AlkP superfamily enzyme|nr:sulfatase-like hydrolase/transferase [Prevotellaceae bacterium]